MNKLSTLNEFLEATGTRLQAFDMGRRVSPISPDQFVQFESTQTPYPLPLQRQAWLGLLLQDIEDQQAEPAIWFIRLPLDEQAKLVFAARDEFLHRLLESMDNNLSRENREKMQAALADSPFAFRPKPERMAVFHAKVTVALQQPPSHYYAHSRDYFSGKLGWDQWSFLGYQGIADLAARLATDGNADLLAAAIPELPPSPFEALCHCLENERLPGLLAQALTERVTATLQQEPPDPQLLTAAIRGISQAPAEQLRGDMLKEILCRDIARRSDILAAIAGRAWETLTDETVRGLFLQRLAENDQGQEFFDNLLADLLFLPATHEVMLASLRNPDRSLRLSEAIGRFFSRVRGA
jgi:hypothetical protein